MIMNATILDAQVGDFRDGVDVNLYDLDEKETYKAQIVEGLGGLVELRQLKRQGASLEVLDEAAAQVEMPPVMQPIPVFVRRVRVNKGFMKLVCRLERA
jgi:hypothetical protein